MNEHTYKTIGKAAFAEFKDRGSKFLAYAFAVDEVEDIKKYLQQIKKEHAKARHHCFAYRLDPEGLQFRTSDAGEPSGSAGKPILGQIDRLGLSGVLVIVVRYFGGTLLGIPGLINAYKTAAALALQMTPLITRNREKHIRLHYDYTLMDQVMRIIRAHECRILHQDNQLFCVLEIGVPLLHQEICLRQFNEMPSLEVMYL